MTIWDRWKKTTIANQMIVVLTFVIGVITAVNVAVAIKQANDGDKLVGIADKIKAALNDSVEQNKKNMEATVAQGDRTLRDTLADSERTLKATLSQNRESLKATLTQGRDALDISTKNSQLDQRPWTTVARFVLSAEPEDGKEFQVQYWPQNTGKTPSLSQTNQSKLYLWFGEPQMTFPELNKTASIIILPPSSENINSKTTPWKPESNLVKLYRAKTLNLYIHILIRYRDIFGTPHWTTVCAFHIYGNALSDFSYCHDGNEMDSNQNKSDPEVPKLPQ